MFIYRMPQLVLSFVLIYAGVRMIRSRKKQICNAESDDERYFSEIFKDSDEDYYNKADDSETNDRSDTADMFGTAEDSKASVFPDFKNKEE